MAYRVLHEPRLDTILMVEKALIDSEDYPTRTELWRRLPRRIQYQTFKRILDYLEATGRIVYDGRRIIYTGVANPKLLTLIETAKRIR